MRKFSVVLEKVSDFSCTDNWLQTRLHLELPNNQVNMNKQRWLKTSLEVLLGKSKTPLIGAVFFKIFIQFNTSTLLAITRQWSAKLDS